MKNYAGIIEKGPTNYGASIPEPTSLVEFVDAEVAA